MSCERPYGFQYPACSGHASDCLSDACICNSGWTSIGDFQLREGYDCSINKLVIVIWSSVNAYLALQSIVIISYCIHKEKLWTRAKFFKLKNVCYISFLFLNGGGLAYSILKIINQDKHALGLDIMTSLAGVILVSAVVTGGSAFVLILSKFLKGYSRMLDSKRREHFNSAFACLQWVLPIAPPLTFVGLIVIAVACMNMDKHYSDQFCSSFMAVTSTAYAFYAVCVEYIVYVFQSEVTSYFKQRRRESTAPILIQSNTTSKTNGYKFVQSSKKSGKAVNRDAEVNADLKRIHDKIKYANIILIPFFICGIGLNIIFASWGFLRRQSQYLNCFQICFLQIVVPAVALSVSNISKNAKISPTLQSSIITDENRIKVSSLAKVVVVGRRSQSTCV